MSNGYTVTVTALNEYVATLLSRDPLLTSLSVEGEVSGFKQYSSGHCYFSLKDEGAVIRCVMFKQNANGLDFRPEDGMRVVVSGRVSVYPKDGQYQLYANEMRRLGVGELYKRFTELKEKLHSQGLFAERHKKQIPFLPKRVGVITSKSGAVHKDIMSVVQRRFPGMPVVLCHCAVQGVDAPGEIIAAVNKLDTLGMVDVIIVGRGGGSIEDLWAFNDEGVARAIFACKTPIISAVGHETDFTIADFVADLRAPTPSAAAELAVPLLSELEADLIGAQKDMLSMLRNRLFHEREFIETAARTGAFVSVKIRVDNELELIARAKLDMQAIIKDKLLQLERDLELASRELDALSPATTLKRGYAYVRSQDGHIISKAAALKRLNTAAVTFADGTVDVSVIKSKPASRS